MDGLGGGGRKVEEPRGDGKPLTQERGYLYVLRESEGSEGSAASITDVVRLV